MTRDGYNILAIVFAVGAVAVAVVGIVTGLDAKDVALESGPMVTAALTLAGRGERP